MGILLTGVPENRDDNSIIPLPDGIRFNITNGAPLVETIALVTKLQQRQQQERFLKKNDTVGKNLPLA